MRKIALLLLALACAPALANWVEVAPMDDGVGTLYVDPATIELIHGSIRRAWQMGDFKNPDRDGILSYARLLDFDCGQGKIHDVETYFYSGHRASGETLKKLGEATNSTPMQPGTPSHRVLQFVCSH
jgi:surface-adhesin protein E